MNNNCFYFAHKSLCDFVHEIKSINNNHQKSGTLVGEAFLEYIRKQAKDFTAGVLQKMIQFKDFNNLKMKEEHKEVQEGVQADQREDNEDGPESIPFNVQFSQLALKVEGGELTQRQNFRQR